MALTYGSLTDCFNLMIGRSISTIAFDTDFVIKIDTIILYFILYIVRHIFLQRQFSDCFALNY